MTAAPGAPPKTSAGNFFEDFAVGQRLVHATPRTVTSGDVALYTALTGNRFAVASSDPFAAALGFRAAPVDPLLAFNIVFGKTVTDISLNAVANLGYAEGRFLAPVYPGDTLSAASEVIGVKQNSNGKTGTVYVRTTGTNQDGTTVLDYVRWVMVAKRDPGTPGGDPIVPALKSHVPASELVVPIGLETTAYNTARAGAAHLWDDYAVGERIDHVDGMTIEEAEHQMATRLYQNTARVHFDAARAAGSRFGKRLMYGGHVISMARALSFNGLANAFWIAAINGGRHVFPAFAGDTLYAWSEILAVEPLPNRNDLGALRLRTIATRDYPCADFPNPDAESASEQGGRDAVLLDFDYTVLMPRKTAGSQVDLPDSRG
jgi:2-methylfumaryl-CoA hydratase